MSRATKFEDTGYAIRDAIKNATKWWDSTGRRLINKDLDQYEKTRVSFSGGGPMLRFKDKTSETNSGILHGLPFDELTKNEKAEVIKTWHHNFVRVPMLEERMEADQGFQKVLTIICDHPLHDVNVQREYAIKGTDAANVTMQAEQAGFYLSEDHDFCPACVIAFQQTNVAGTA